MKELTGSQRKKLRGLAHSLNPVAWVGKEGLSNAFLTQTGQALADHELVKIKFNDFKEEKKELAAELAQKLSAHLCGLIGNVAILFKQNPNPEKRKIEF